MSDSSSKQSATTGRGFMKRAVVAWLICVATVVAADAPPPAKKSAVIPHAQSVMPGAALSPADAIKKMVVPEGFKVELVAAEPDLINPVAMTFDERGRIWVTESFEYPRLSAGPGRDRIKVLEDTDGDGTADKVTIFAEGLNIPSGIAVGHGGVWVANSPDLLFLQDTNGDGKADKQEVVVTGFGRADTHELPNSLTWGPDGWLYGLNGVFNPSKIVHGGKTHEFTCALFRIHPRTRDFEVFCEGTSNPWGIAIDREGSFFVSACVIDHLWHLVETGYYHRQGGPYPPHTWKIESIVKHKHHKAAYCGITYFDSDAYPESYREKLYMGNIHGNSINVDRLERDGSTYRGLPEPDFLVANDAWFMPVVQKTGPDGCLYILDWYDRYHCYQDARRDPEGIDRGYGRLYRVRYNDTPRAPKFDLAKETDEQLIERLKSPNVFYRDIAQRLLTERATPNIIDALAKDVVGAPSLDKGQLHSLWVLASVAPEKLGEAAFFDHSDARVRAWSLRASPSVVKQVAGKLSQRTPAERLQAVIAAGKLNEAPEEVLFAALKDAPDDLHLARVAWSNVKRIAQRDPAFVARFQSRLDQLAADKPHAAIDALTLRSLESLTSEQATALQDSILANRNPRPGVYRNFVLTLLNNISSGQWKSEPFARWSSVLAERRQLAAEELFVTTRLAAVLGNREAIEHLQTFFVDEKQSDAQRVQAFESLVTAHSDQVEDLAHRTLPDGGASLDLRRGILLALTKLRERHIGKLIVDAYEHLDPELLPIAVEALTERLAWAELLVQAVERKQIPPEAVNLNQVRTLLSMKQGDIAERAQAIWGSVRTDRNPDREKVVYEMRNLLKNNSGDPHKGMASFQKLCGQCHKIYGQGQEVGPDITVNGRASLDQLLSNVFDPSLVIGRIYQAYTVVTADGRTLTGLIVEDSPQRVVLKVQGGKLETIARNNIDEMALSKLSLMPEGVEKQFSQAELLDLLAFLRLDKPPSDSTAKPIPDVKK